MAGLIANIVEINFKSHVFVGVVFQRYVCGFVSGEPGEVFINPGGVYHHEEGFRFHAVQDQVVDDAGLFVKHDGVLALADVQLVDVVGEHGVQPCRRVRAGYRELAHVGDVKDAAGLEPNGQADTVSAIPFYPSEISTKSGDFFTYDYLHATIDDHYFVECRCADGFYDHPVPL